MKKTEALKFRKVELEDAYLFLDIIEALGIEEFKDCFKNKKFEEELREVNKASKEDKKINNTVILNFGYEVVFNIISKIIKNLKKCKKEVYILIAALSGEDLEKVNKLSLWKVAKNLLEISKDEDFIDFLEVASSLKK